MMNKKDTITFENLPPETKAELIENSRADFVAEFQKLYTEQRYLSTEDWMNTHHVLPGDAAEAGRYSMDRTPVLKEIAAALDSTEDRFQCCALKKGGQLGASELGVGFVGKTIHQNPCNVMWFAETGQKAKRAMKSRIQPMLQTNAFRGVLKKKDAFLSEVKYPGGMLTTWGAQSSNAFSSTSAPVLVLDEFARYPTNVQGEGSPITLAQQRAATFGSRVKIFVPSTPLEGDASEGSFEALYRSGDQRQYYIACPGCGHMDYLRRDRFNIVRDPETNEIDGHVHCEECGELNDEKSYKAGLAEGEWRPTKDRSDESVAYNVTSWQLPGLLAPLGWMTWKSVAQRLHDAQRGKISMMAVINLAFGESWQEELECPEPEDIRRKHTEERQRGIVHPEVGLCTLCVDVQRGWLSWEAYGWSKDQKRFSIEKGVIDKDLSSKEGWKLLDEVLMRDWYKENGARYTPAVIGIDSGDGSSTTDVYKYVSRWPQPVHTNRGWQVRSPRTVVAMKGASKGGSEQIIVRRTDIRRRIGMARGIKLWFLDTVTLKTEFYRILAYDKDDHDRFGKANFPAGYEDSYFQELVSEQPVVKRHGVSGQAVIRFNPPSGRNEALDLACMNRAAAEIAGLPYMTSAWWESRINKRPDPTPPPPTDLKEAKDGGPSGPQKPPRPKRQRRGFSSLK